MSQVTDTVLKGYFNTGDTPTESQYEDLVDSKRNVADTVPRDEVENGEPLSIAFNPSGSVVIPAGALITHIVCIGTGNGTFLVGSTPGGSDIYSDAVVAGNTEVYNVAKYYASAATLYIGGTGAGTALIFLR